MERDIDHIKDNLCLAGRRTQNEQTLHADLILAGITQLITVILGIFLEATNADKQSIGYTCRKHSPLCSFHYVCILFKQLSRTMVLICPCFFNGDTL